MAAATVRSRVDTPLQSMTTSAAAISQMSDTNSSIKLTPSFAGFHCITVNTKSTTRVGSESLETSVPIELPKLFNRSIIKAVIQGDQSQKTITNNGARHLSKQQTAKIELVQLLDQLPDEIEKQINNISILSALNCIEDFLNSKAKGTCIALKKAIETTQDSILQPEHISLELGTPINTQLAELIEKIENLDEQTLEDIYFAMQLHAHQQIEKQKDRINTVLKSENKDHATKNTDQQEDIRPAKNAFWVKSEYIQDDPKRYFVHHAVNESCNYLAMVVGALTGAAFSTNPPAALSPETPGRVVSIQLTDTELDRRFQNMVGYYYTNNPDNLSFIDFYSNNNSIENLRAAHQGYTYGETEFITQQLQQSEKNLSWIGVIIGITSGLTIQNPIFKGLAGGCINKLYYACKKEDAIQDEQVLTINNNESHVSLEEVVIDLQQESAHTSFTENTKKLSHSAHYQNPNDATLKRRASNKT